METPQNQFKVWRFASLFIFFAILLGCLLYFWNSISSERTFSPGQIIRGKLGSDHRKLIQISDDGYYIVQDFRGTGKPATNPYRIKDRDDLLRDYSEQRSIDGVYVRADNDEVVYSNYRNGLKDEPAVNFVVILQNACNTPISVSTYIKNVVSENSIEMMAEIIDIDCRAASDFVSLALGTLNSCLPDNYKLIIAAEDKKRVLDKQQLLDVLKNAAYASGSPKFAWVINDPSLCPK
jgi:hypothetical protein